jgi:hypothetical protein
VAKKPVQDAEAAIRMEQGDTEAAQYTGLASGVPETTLHEILVAIGGSLSDIK